jgi:hypothetical protein
MPIPVSLIFTIASFGTEKNTLTLRVADDNPTKVVVLFSAQAQL